MPRMPRLAHHGRSSIQCLPELHLTKRAAERGHQALRLPTSSGMVLSLHPAKYLLLPQVRLLPIS